MTNSEQIKTISFFDTVSALSEKTIASDRISSPYEIQQIAASFALNTSRKLQLKFFDSLSSHQPSSGEPNANNWLTDYGQVDYIVGDGEKKVLTHNVQILTHPSYILIYANNTDSFIHTIDVLIQIKLIERS